MFDRVLNTLVYNIFLIAKHIYTYTVKTEEGTKGKMDLITTLSKFFFKIIRFTMIYYIIKKYNSSLASLDTIKNQLYFKWTDQ